MLNPNETLSFEGFTLYKTVNKDLISPNKKLIKANTLISYCSPTVEIGKNVFICSDVKICDNAVIEDGVYLGQNVIIRDRVRVPKGSIVSPTSVHKIHNKTAEQVEEFFKN